MRGSGLFPSLLLCKMASLLPASPPPACPPSFTALLPPPSELISGLLNFLSLPHGKLPRVLSGPPGWPWCREAIGEGGTHGKQEACSRLPTGHCPWNVLQEPPPPNDLKVSCHPLPCPRLWEQHCGVPRVRPTLGHPLPTAQPSFHFCKMGLGMRGKWTPSIPCLYRAWNYWLRRDLFPGQSGPNTRS